MIADQQPRLPAWLCSDHHQPFVLTICAADDLNDVLSLLQDEFAAHRFEHHDILTARACRLVFSCKPAEAWTLLRSLQARVDRADVYLRPQTEAATRLLICDMDMTIVAAETLDEVAAMIGIGDKVAAITHRTMLGEMDFNDALTERVKLLAGQSDRLFRELAQTVPLNPGAETLVSTAKAAGVHCILVSGGFSQVAEPIATRLGFTDVFCNQLELDAGVLTGEIRNPIVNADYKSELLQRRAQSLGIGLAECCAIGDGANDVPMVSTAGLGIAYHAKPVLREATHCRIDVTDLTSAIHFMGLPIDLSR